MTQKYGSLFCCSVPLIPTKTTLTNETNLQFLHIFSPPPASTSHNICCVQRHTLLLPLCDDVCPFVIVATTHLELQCRRGGAWVERRRRRMGRAHKVKKVQDLNHSAGISQEDI